MIRISLNPCDYRDTSDRVTIVYRELAGSVARLEAYENSHV